MKRVDHKTLRWLDRKGHGDIIPKAVQTGRTFETVDTYENRIVKKHLSDLIRLLGKYKRSMRCRAKRRDISTWHGGG